MNKRILLVGVLSITAIAAVVFIQKKFFSPPAKKAEAAAGKVEAREKLQDAPVKEPYPVLRGGESGSEGRLILENDVLMVVFDAGSAVPVSFVLKRYKDGAGNPVDLLYRPPGDGVSPGGFEDFPFFLRFGDAAAPPLKAVFTAASSSAGGKIAFSTDITASTGEVFTLVKTFSLAQKEYVLALDVAVYSADGKADLAMLSSNGQSYTLSCGPQLGPPYVRLDGKNDYRLLSYYNGANRKGFSSAKPGVRSVADDKVLWAAAENKYFALVMTGELSGAGLTLDSRPLPGLAQTSRCFLPLPECGGARSERRFYLYAGPKDPAELSRYDSGDTNSFGLSGSMFGAMLAKRGILSYLARGVKAALFLFYRLTRNMGVAILLLALLFKLVFLPLTWKSAVIHRKLYKCRDELKAIREKYPSDGNKRQEATAELYTREGISDRPRFLPLLLQLPIILGLYRLLGEDIDVRLMKFLGSWIPDVTQPDMVVSFYPTVIPVLNWDGIRFLPFLMLGAMILQTRATQPPEIESRSAKIMTYALPVAVFLILYNMPSGLTLYWLAYSLFSVVQHVCVNAYLSRRETASRL